MTRALVYLLICCSAAAQVIIHGPTATPISLGQTYLINQTFEGTGYDNSETWSESAGSPNEDYTSTVLDGSQSLYMDGRSATQSTDSPNFGDTGEIWFKFYFRPITLPGAGREVIRFLLNGSQQQTTELQVDASGRLNLINGTSGSLTASGMTAGNNYTVWGYIKKGSGTDGISRIAWAPKTGSESRPTSDGGGNGYNLNSACNGTADIDQFRVTAQFSTSGPEYVMDKLQVSTSDIP